MESHYAKMDEVRFFAEFTDRAVVSNSQEVQAKACKRTHEQAVRKWVNAADGLHTYIVLLEGSGGVDDCVILQVKEATDSVLSLCFGPSIYGHHDQRVVMGQRLMRAISDRFLW